MGECGGVEFAAGCLGFFAPPSLAIIGVGTPLAGSDASPPLDSESFELYIGGELASFVGHRATATDEFAAFEDVPPMEIMFEPPIMLVLPTRGGVDAGRAGAGTEAPSLAIATASGVRWIGFAASPASVVSLPESEGERARRSAPGISAGWWILPGAGVVCCTARRSSATATVMARGRPSADEDGRGCGRREVS